MFNFANQLIIFFSFAYVIFRVVSFKILQIFFHFRINVIKHFHFVNRLRFHVFAVFFALQNFVKVFRRLRFNFINSRFLTLIFIYFAHVLVVFHLNHIFRLLRVFVVNNFFDGRRRSILPSICKVFGGQINLALIAADRNSSFNIDASSEIFVSLNELI